MIADTRKVLDGRTGGTFRDYILGFIYFNQGRLQLKGDNDR